MQVAERHRARGGAIGGPRFDARGPGARDEEHAAEDDPPVVDIRTRIGTEPHDVAQQRLGGGGRRTAGDQDRDDERGEQMAHVGVVAANGRRATGGQRAPRRRGNTFARGRTVAEMFRVPPRAPSPTAR
jgi:hypothetical protein